ncbi:ArsC family reductase [Variovorax sp. PCZ-1]|uniref:ArsC family reductase n=1 Tax=Variovorax sp. PCZ-1 TaxID=2835533 RepID=UPI001BCA9C2E|nr:ArsC family reductase [Variovorax sp. PCZ-1]MBS7806555.1 ArsC family reductase [Variovorax sp. PCZ-1]
MSTAITLFGIPNCDTVKKSRAWFDQAGVAYHFHDFKKQGVPEADLRQWVKALGWEALVNKKGTTWRKLDEATQAGITDAETAIALMLSNSSVIKRPVVVKGSHISVGYSPEKW